MSRFAELEAFVAVVDAASFSGAAAHLDLSKSYVSKLVSRLEARLGVRLLQRTTRQLSLTAEGRVLYERGVEILEDLLQAERTVQDQQGTPRGTLRLSVPISYGRRFLARPLAQFLASHEELSVEVEFSDEKVDLIEEAWDVAIRIGQLQDSSLFARKLHHSHMLLCASPGYLQAAPLLHHPHDLRHHHCLRYTYQSTGAMWRFVRQPGGPGSEEVSLKPPGRFVANNGDALLVAALEGLGVVRLPDFFVQGDLEAGHLVRLLPDWSCGEQGVWAIYPHSKHLSAKVKVFVDFIQAHGRA